MSGPTRSTDPLATRQMLTFRLGEELFAVDILRVQEIRGWSPVTRIPQSPPHLLGVLNLRGSIVPIIDLRLRLDLERADFTPLTVIIVLSVGSATGPRELGLVVDGVSDVIDVDRHAMRELPALGGRMSAELVEGLAAVEKRMLILLNVDELKAQEIDSLARDCGGVLSMNKPQSTIAQRGVAS
jgi:purine-binding chemotaxis protein CheW